MTEASIGTLGLILLTASLVAILSRRLRLPYSAGLVFAGIGLAILPTGIQLSLTRDLIFDVFLPPLVFDAALRLKWSEFRRELPLTVGLAVPGVLIAAAAVAAGMHLLVGWSWIGAGLFGMLIAATDPVAVIATFKVMAVDRRLKTVVESESLLNDGTAVVGFGVLAVFAAGDTMTPLAMAGDLLWSVAGGIATGLCFTGALLFIAGRIDDHLVEITLTSLAAFGSFMLAEDFHMSGVLATVAAGLLVGNFGWRHAISPGSRGHVLDFWEYAAFLANSVVFILIGVHEAGLPVDRIAGPAAAAILLVLAGRALAVYPFCALFARSALAIGWDYQHVLVWGGQRGAMALALALVLPEDLPERHEIVWVAFAVVAFSIFVQGLTMPGLIRRLGLLRPPS